MASRLKSLAEWAGIVQSSRYDDEEDEFTVEPHEPVVVEVRDHMTEHVPATPPPPVRQANVTPIDTARRSRTQPVREASLEEIAHLRPRSYTSDATKIAESYKEGVPVIINMEDLDDQDAFRLIDFSAGLRYALDGTLEKITSRVFLLSPPSVRVTAREKERLAQTGLIAAQL